MDDVTEGEWEEEVSLRQGREGGYRQDNREMFGAL